MPSSLDLAGRLAGVVAAQQEILGSITDLDRVLEKVVESSAELTDASGAVVEVVDGDVLVYRAASGTAKQHLGASLPLQGSLSGHAVAERKVMRSDDTEADPRVDRDACRRIGVRSMIVAPLVEGGRAIGVLKVYSDRKEAFGDLDVYVVQLLAGMSAGALLQARTFEESRNSEERYRMLFERNVAGVFRSTREGRILDCNEALVTYFGYGSREELMAQPTWDLYQERAERESLLASLQSGSPMTNVRLHFRRKDGSAMTALMNVSLVGGQLLGTIVSEPT
jgi:PAS domain S-box-containing protein